MRAVTDAARRAFDYVTEMETLVRQDKTSEEFLASSDVAVESARYDGAKCAWIIGVGFVRAWGRVKSTASIILGGTLKASV